jgi:hypothetical protein
LTALRIVAPPPAGTSWYDPQPGEMWPCAWEQHQLDGRAPCWVVRLPGGGYCWHTNSESTTEGEGLWNVTGEPPNLTVTPSINVGPEIWHGWITDGQLTPETDRDGK